ncbi:MAG TPA: hypothetical protein VGQ29_00315 [Gemmatimonadales bacterium]|jgi:Tol biopolymer transport system component|nr:hypothetical protein [Gemmatimonadales bacterium]
MSIRCSRLVSLTSLTLGLACAAEHGTDIDATLAASHSSNFSEWSEPVSLGPTINTSFNDQQAMLSKDGLTMFFASNRPGTPGPGPNDIWVSRRDCLDCAWSAPVNLGAPVNTGANESAPALSRDGHQLFFLSNRTGSASSDIWVAHRENVHDDLGWEAPVNLGAGVNTTGFDGGAGYFENDDLGAPQLFFNRNPLPSPFGGDIFVSELGADGTFGPATLVAELSSPFTDQKPSVAHTGLEIYFHSDRPGSADQDLWVSTRESVLARWSTPVNVGFPINSAAGEQFAFIVSHGQTEWLYFSRNMATPPAFDFDLFVSTRSRTP